MFVFCALLVLTLCLLGNDTTAVVKKKKTVQINTARLNTYQNIPCEKYLHFLRQQTWD